MQSILELITELATGSRHCRRKTNSHLPTALTLLLLVVDLKEIVLHPRVHLKEHFVVQNSAARDAGLPRRGLKEIIK
jgi:hypothetical protein